MFFSLSNLRRICGALPLLALSTTVLLTGCQMTGTAMPGTDPIMQSGITIQGSVYGGQQPIGGSVVQLYQVGVGPSAGVYTGMAIPLISTTVTSNYTNGGFSITGDYSCAAGSYVYLTASGGSPDGNPSDTNPNIAEVAALGPCATLKANAATANIHVSEVTTVAAAYALAQFATTTNFGTALSAQPGSAGSAGPPVVAGTAPADNIVTSPSNATGLANAMSVAQVLANAYSYSGTPTGLSPGSNTNGGATAEYWTINTIADALSSCVNTVPGAVSSPTDGSTCGNLYKYTTPTGKTAPADIFQAALYLALYPTNAGVLTGTPAGSNLVNLIGLNPAYMPYVNTSVTGNTINDWTVAINYVPVITGTSTPLLASPYYIAADSVGNIWAYDILQGTGSPASYLTEIDPTGNPVFAGETTCPASPCVLKDFAVKTYNASTSSTTSVTIGQQPGNSSPSGIAIDPSNNVWVSDRGGTKFNIFRVVGSGTGSVSNGGGTSTTSSSAAVGYNLGSNNLPVGMAVDGNGNPWWTQYVKSGQGTAAPNGSCTSQSEPTSSTPQVLGTLVSGAPQIGGPGYSGGSLIAIDAGNPSCTASTTTLCNSTIYDTLAGGTTAIAGAPFIWIPFATSGTLPNAKAASFVGHYTTGNGLTGTGSNTYTVPGCLSQVGFLGSPNTTSATPTTGITAINPSGSDQIEYGSSIRVVAIGKSGYVWSINNNPTDASSTVSSSLQRFLPNYGTAFTSASFVTAEASPAFTSYTGGGLGGGYAVQNMIMDGSGGPWMTGNVGSSKTSYIVHFDANGNAISPSTGITGTVCTSGSTVLSRTNGQTSYGLAVDPSGNVWVADGDEGTGNSTTLTSNSMYEIVGAAAPVVTPISAGVKYGTLATMP
jgi:hypothetical protein